MGESHADRVHRGLEAYNAGDFEAVLATVTEDVTWKRVDGLPDEGGTLHGRDAVRELFRPDAQGQPALRREIGLVLSADHRVHDGVGALAFLKRVVDHLQRPLGLLVS